MFVEKNKLTKIKNKLNLKNNKLKNKLTSNLLLVITFFTGVLLIISSYAWLSASLNVKVKFFDLVVSTDNGLFISLDGINFSDSVEISAESLIANLKETYSQNTNQWSSGGLWPVSTIGIKNPNMDKFDIYKGEVSRFRLKTNRRRFLTTRLSEETYSTALNTYIAFDLFFKNVSGSPKSDNLYLDEGTAIEFSEGTEDSIKDSMSNIMNSMRFGFLKMASTSLKSDVKTIQNLNCDNNCLAVLYEPNGLLHSTVSIESALENGVVLQDGQYMSTYAVVEAGSFLEYTSGLDGSGIQLDTEHFQLQRTVKDFDEPIFQIPNGITKIRVYVWIEGQDIDSLETNSAGAAVNLSINFVKDLAGYYN